jgi:outer membrane protein OmpA-like peptidoglycan-associated protein
MKGREAVRTTTFEPSFLMAGTLQRKCASCGQHTVAGGGCNSCNKETDQRLRRAAINNESASDHHNEVPPIVHDALRSPGQPLDPHTRAFMEPRLGHDFSRVRVHSDSTAAESARSVNAVAYTVGQDIVLGDAHYPSRSSAKLGVLAHELTHTIQQSRRGESASSSLRLGPVDDAHEREADAQSQRVLNGGRAAGASMPSVSWEPAVQRLGDLTRIPPGLACGTANLAPPATIDRVLFGNRTTDPTPLDRVRIDNFIVNWRAAGGNVPLRVVGYASTPGTDELNWQLSCDRAQSVANELMNPAAGIPGIPAALITMVAQGETTEFGAEAENRRATILANFPRQPTPRPGAPPATGVVFSESRSPAEQFSGYDNSVAPNSLVVPVGGARIAEATITPAGASPTFVSLNPAIATVVATAGGISVTGIADGPTTIEAREGAVVLATLAIEVKDRRDLTVDYHVMSDSHAPVHQTTRTAAASTPLTNSLNQIWERQANVHFATGVTDARQVPIDLGPDIVATVSTDPEWVAVIAFATGGNYNVFLIWEYNLPPGGIDNAQAGTAASNTLLEDHDCADNLTLPHEAGHFLSGGIFAHTAGTIMAICGSPNRRRVTTAQANVANP